MRSADEIFRSELDRRGIRYSIMPDGRYELPARDQTLTVSLENIRRNFDHDGDVDAVVRFANTVSGAYAGAPAWDDVQAYIRYSLEPTDRPSGFDDVLFRPISDELNQVFVWVSTDGSRVTWINESMLDDWGVSREQIITQAEKNMAAIVARTKLEIVDIDGNKLGMLATPEVAFKASFVLSPAFRDLVSPTHGWPVFVVIPCRDFVYVITTESREFLARLGGVVIEQYRTSGYPITKDVLLVSDDGITAIGTYPESR